MEEKLYCMFCGKECKNLNSLKQHEVRCPSNPNRRAFNNLGEYSHRTRKGQTKETNADILKYAESLKRKYQSGWNPLKGRTRILNYVYLEHNNLEIQHWVDYVKSLNIIIPNYNICKHNANYNIISGSGVKYGSTVKFIFEHDFIANLLLNGQLNDYNTVHHIDNNGFNNSPNNLMVFESGDDHKRFHNSNYAWLEYNEKLHTFSCRINR